MDAADGADLRRMKKTIVLATMLLLVLLVASPAGAASCKTKLCRVEVQNRALRAQVRTLKQKLEIANQKLAKAQESVQGAISTMPPAMIWGLFPVIASVYSTPAWSNSYFSSGPDYESWSFTRCGFC